jgi:pyruvate,water dikinase
MAPEFSLQRCIDTFYRDLPQDLEFYRQAMTVDFDNASFEEVLTTFRALEDRFVGYCIKVSHALIDHAYTLVLVLTAMLRRWCGDSNGAIYGALASGLPRNRTVQENIDVWKLSRLVRNEPELCALFESSAPVDVLARLPQSAAGAAFRETLDGFLAEYGHRGGSERDLAYPRWRHRPELLLGAIKALISADDSHDPELTEARLMERRRNTVRECLERVRSRRWGFIELPLFRFVLGWSEKYFLFRDDERFYADYFMTARHDFALALGRRLVHRGLVDQDTDVFFLALEEIVDAWEGRIPARHVHIRVRARRAIHDKYRVRAPAMLLRGMHSLDNESADVGTGNVLRGVAASGGRVTARARVCHSLEETGKVGKGDILVACATDPGWTPVFSVLGGVVIETGGILAHATLVSREYGIPCVMNVARATERIVDGQIITIDGDAGAVIIEAAEGERSEEPAAAAATG